MNHIRSVVISSAFALVLCGLANADSLAINCSLASGLTELGPAANGTITCADFNEGLGTLTGISLTLDGAEIAPSSIDVTNNSASSESGSANTSSAFSLNAATPLTGFAFTSPVFTVTATTGPLVLAAGASTGPIAVTGSNSETESDTGSFSPYETVGAGMFDITADTSTGITALFGGGNVSVTQLTTDSFTAQVVYTYTTTASSTPEPATMALLGSGLIGLGLIRRKNHKKV